MDNLANPMQIIQTHKCLLRYFPHYRDWNAPIIVFFDHGKKVFAQDFKGHYRVSAVGADMEELVKHLEIMGVVSLNLEVGLV